MIPTFRRLTVTDNLVTDNLLRYSSYRKAPQYLDSYVDLFRLFRAPLHEVNCQGLLPARIYTCIMYLVAWAYP